ncbi:MAG: DUF3048 domain-containing protein [Candidatus Buchananbacteria bacterium]|nr:DUF3048 domain-containing protein [Candidatus Buchananbacteria bacterium]
MKLPSVRIRILLAIIAAAIIAVGFFVWTFNSRVEAPWETNRQDQPADNRQPRALNGELVAPELVQEPIVGLMIENHVDARPQAGLAAASIVYEALAEGGITRFLAIYPVSTIPERVGPVRSARPYYIDLASEYGALYGHSGGSPEALARLKNDSHVTDLNEYSNGKYFWRDSVRYAPHDLLTSGEKLRAAAIAKELATSTVSSWKFGDQSFGTSTPTVSLNYSSYDTHRVTWQYDATSTRYIRFQGNEEHQDESGVITADTIIIQIAPTEILDAVGRRDIDLIGSGKGYLIRNGQRQAITWHKNSAPDRTQFKDQFGGDVSLKPGKIWIEIVPDESVITF